jgi:hypothetical protein
VTENEIGVSFWLKDDEMWKDDVTVADLIKTLQDFPPDLKVSAYFDCLVDETDEIVFIEDKRVIELLNIISACPVCNAKVEFVSTEDTLN